jgi:P27 family predicted phage terminase small subunit
MPGGRPRKSNAAKLAEGDLRKIGKRKLAELAEAEQALATRGRPQLPPGVKLGKIGMKFWNDVLDELDRQNRLAVVDGFSIAMVAAAYDLAFTAHADINKRGQLIQVKSAKGVIQKVNPSIIIFADQSRIVKQFLVEHGLTEASRSRLQKVDNRKTDDLEDLLSGPPATSIGNGARVQ